MAEDNALRLIYKIISTRDLTQVLERGVTEDMFLVDEHRNYYRWILNHYKRYGEVPSRALFQDNWRNVTVTKIGDTIEVLLDAFIDYQRWNKTRTGIRRAVELFESDHNAALAYMAGLVQEVEANSSIKSRDLDLTKDPLTRYAEYEERAARGSDLLGVPSGFPTIDEATAGFQPGQLITVVAIPKAGKSTLMMKMAVNTHARGLVPWFQSFEMSNREQRDRHDAIRAQVNHARLTRGTLHKDEVGRFRDTLTDMGREHQFVLSDATEGLTLSAIQAKILKYQPDIAYVDGVYLMYDEVTGERNTPQALTNITRNFKNLAQRAGIPIVISTQALQWKMRGGKLKADSIGYSSSFFQDSDVILGLEFFAEEDEDDNMRILKVIASRNCGPAEATLLWDWGKANFTETAVAA